MNDLEPLTEAILRIMESGADEETIRLALMALVALSHPKALAEVLQ